MEPLGSEKSEGALMEGQDVKAEERDKAVAEDEAIVIKKIDLDMRIDLAKNKVNVCR